jgi:hypothetical protein
MHLPEKWGMLQFAEGGVNGTLPLWNAEWPVRSVAAAVYYAQHAYAGANNATFTSVLSDLVPFLESPDILDGTCTQGIPVSLGVYTDVSGASRFNATVPPSSVGSPTAVATITDQRLLQVTFPTQQTQQ